MEWFRALRQTWRRDCRLLKRGLGVLAKMAWIKARDRNVIQMFRKTVATDPDKVMFVNIADGSEWTFKQVEEYSNKVANYFLSQGYEKGNVVALFMENRPEYVATWLGLAKIGVITALINFNLRKTSLIHTIRVAECCGIIYGLELEDAVEEVYEELSRSRSFFPAYCSRSGTNIPGDVHMKMEGSVNLDTVLGSFNADCEPKIVSDSIHAQDPLLYIYTSGTTGLPKAVVVKHVRQLFTAHASHCMIGLTQEDVIYCHLPLYHSSGTQVAMSSSLFFGAKTIIRNKFSATSFWKDCAAHKVTAAPYIGEICRYLLASPPAPDETSHSVRIMYGNGLRAEIWPKFVERFNIPDIVEYYAATEGNCTLMNIENRVGAVGFIGVCLPDCITEYLMPLTLILVDKDTGEPVRDANGYCTKCAPGQPGEFIGKIIRGDPIKDFPGYRDPEATKKKILTDVFCKGDSYFRSGDILVKDDIGWFYFRDRLGDTFRWKGENVSSAEVESTVSKILDLKDATSYGVLVPGTEGRAGMIALPDVIQASDLAKLQSGLAQMLPSYARPTFVRLVPHVELTGTYKLKKTSLQSQGFNPNEIDDQLYYMDTVSGQYKVLTSDIYTHICNGTLRL